MKGNNTKKRDSVGGGRIKSNRTTLLWSERHTISISDSVKNPMKEKKIQIKEIVHVGDGHIKSAICTVLLPPVLWK